MLPTDCHTTAAQVAASAFTTPAAMAGQPSTHSESASSGGTAAALDHTTYASMFTWPARLLTMLAQAQEKAAVSTMRSPATVASPPVCAPITPMPAAPSKSASHW